LTALRRCSLEAVLAISIGLLLGVLLLLTACDPQRAAQLPTITTAAAATHVIDVTARDARAPVALATGELLRVHLPQSLATGERWELALASPELRLESDPGQLTDGTIRTWTFRALRPGPAWLRFDPRRGWEQLDHPGQPLLLELHIH
jgi:predicted secreted protein